MIQRIRWLALIALAATVGCQQSKTSSSTTTSGSTQTSETTSSEPGSSSSSATGGSASATTTTPATQEVALSSGLKYVDLTVGTGAIAASGDNVSVHYTGWLTDGTKFDSSVDRGQPFQFQLGTGSVIKGWDQGVAGMRIGGKRKLTIPPDLGYGAQGTGGVIPPNATLVFDVELLGIQGK